MESRGQGGQGKGERRETGKPGATPDAGKHARQRPDGRWVVKDPHTGKEVLKPPGWNPDTAKKVGVAAVVGGAIIYTIHVIVTTAPEWAPYVAGAAAF